MKLGEIQAGLLKELEHKRCWFKGCGWSWGGQGDKGGTKRTFETLAKRNLVTKVVDHSDGAVVYWHKGATQ